MPSLPTFPSTEAPLGLIPLRIYGRTAEIRLCVSLLSSTNATAVVLAGMGGSGKTTVALAVARIAQMRRMRVWWIDCEYKPIPLAMLGIAKDLGASDSELISAAQSDSETADLAWRYLRACESRWLLIFDNADDAANLHINERRVGSGAAWVRRAEAGYTLITSRIMDTAIWGPQAQVMELGAIALRDASRMLLALAPEAGDLHSAGMLARKLACLPLALELAATYLARPTSLHTKFDEYASELSKKYCRASRTTAPWTR